VQPSYVRSSCAVGKPESELYPERRDPDGQKESFVTPEWMEVVSSENVSPGKGNEGTPTGDGRGVLDVSDAPSDSGGVF
jgi:hypothetical protein